MTTTNIQSIHSSLCITWVTSNKPLRLGRFSVDKSLPATAGLCNQSYGIGSTALFSSQLWLTLLNSATHTISHTMLLWQPSTLKTGDYFPWDAKSGLSACAPFKYTCLISRCVLTVFTCTIKRMHFGKLPSTGISNEHISGTISQPSSWRIALPGK